MAKVLVTQSKLDTLAEVIGGKSNTEVPLTIDEMIEAADSITGGGITPTGNININSAGVTDVTNYATATVPEGEIFTDASYTFYTDNGVRKWRVHGWAAVVRGDDYGKEGYIEDGSYYEGDSRVFNVVPSNTTVTPSTSSQTIGGYQYMLEGPVTISAMPNGVAGTPTATKGTVYNHAVTVTPSVQNTTGYITGGTKTGTGVTVSASELAYGSQTITTNDTYDVTNLASVTVSVGGGVQVANSDTQPSTASSSISFTGLSGEPTSFIITATSELITGAAPYKTAVVVYDGTNVIGQTITNTNNAQVRHDATGFSQSYSNGTLTVTGSGANFQPIEYYLTYTYGGTSGNIQTKDIQVGSGATSITFTDLEDEPLYWSLIFKSDFGTSSGYQRVIGAATNNDVIYGLSMDSSAKYSYSNYSASYSNGTLVISTIGTNAGGYFHQPGYYQLTYALSEAPEITVEPLTVTTNGTYYEAGKAYSPVTVSVSGGGGASVDTTTVTASNRPSSLSFSNMKGTPIAWYLKATFTMTSSSSTYYYVDSIRYNGTNTEGRLFRMGSTRQTENVTSGYSYTYSNSTLTITSTGNRTTSPGCFYNGNYELVYVY